MQNGIIAIQYVCQYQQRGSLAKTVILKVTHIQERQENG